METISENGNFQWPGAIGVFDSGVGGLSVLRAIRDLLPHEDLVYVADSGHAPYGDKSEVFIRQRTIEVGQRMVSLGARALTVACNTATVTSVQELRNAVSVPVVAIEPAIKPAAAMTHSGVVGVLATSQTVRSPSVERLMQLHGSGVQFVLQACPDWVEQVERGELHTEVTLQMVRRDVQALIDAQADVWVLGCTHFPFLNHALRQCAGPQVRLIDPAQAVAQELARRLPLHRLLAPVAPGGDPATFVPQGSTRFYSTGPLALATQVMSHLWGEAVAVHSWPLEHMG